MRPMEQVGNPPCGVFFYGNVTPLHGIDHILGAAEILEKWHKPVNFTIVAGGPQLRTIRGPSRATWVALGAHVGGRCPTRISQF